MYIILFVTIGQTYTSITNYKTNNNHSSKSMYSNNNITIIVHFPSQDTVHPPTNPGITQSPSAKSLSVVSY